MRLWLAVGGSILEVIILPPNYITAGKMEKIGKILKICTFVRNRARKFRVFKNSTLKSTMQANNKILGATKAWAILMLTALAALQACQLKSTCSSKGNCYPDNLDMDSLETAGYDANRFGPPYCLTYPDGTPVHPCPPLGGGLDANDY